MHKLTPKQRQTMVTLRLLGTCTLAQLGQRTGVTSQAAYSVIFKMRGNYGETYIKDVGRIEGNAGQFPTMEFTLAEPWASMPIEELQKTFGVPDLPVLLEESPIVDGQYLSRHALEVARLSMETDPDMAEFIRTNAPYMTEHRLCETLAVTRPVLAALVHLAGASLAEEARDPRANEVSESLNHLPVGTQISQWLGGTSIHLPSNIPGITRVTRHFAACVGV